MEKILVVIPAYNEEKNIGSVLEDIFSQKIELDVLVVSDGSKDKTAKIARERGALVCELPTNLGIGGARQTGLIYAEKKGYQFCVQMDADGQHRGKSIKKLLKAAQDTDVIIGSRFVKRTSYKSANSRLFGIRILSWIIKVLTGKYIADPTSGLRILKGDSISFLAKNYPVDYPEVEPIFYLIRAGFFIKEASVAMKKRLGGRSSIAPIYYMIKVILALFINFFREIPNK